MVLQISLKTGCPTEYIAKLTTNIRRWLTLSQAAGITIEGNDKILTIIQAAAKSAA